MFSWSSRRRFIYAGAVVTGALFIAGFFFYSVAHKPSTCFDGKQNGNESGVDCGGSCLQICALDVAPLVVKWSRAFRVEPGVYNAVAYVENPNSSAGIRAVKYRFDLFDGDNGLVAEREGTAYITPGGISPIFEANIKTGQGIPERTFFEFTENPVWFKAFDTHSQLSIQSRSLTGVNTKPRIDALLRNSSAVDEFSDVDVTAVVFGTDGNAVAASKTVVPLIEPRATKDIVFTWPEPFTKTVEQCIKPADIILILDTSGSMNNDGGNPPQPLQSAKVAALAFISRLSPDDRVGLVSFATNAILTHRLSFTQKDVIEALQELTVLPSEENGSTNIGDAVVLAFNELFRINEERGGIANVERVAVLLTDGRANAPAEPGGEPFALSKAREAKATGVQFYTIGLGDSVNADFLSTVATLPENYYQAASADDLNAIYRSISEAICERGPAVIDIIPQTEHSFVEER